MNCSEFEFELEQLVETRRHRLSDSGKQHIDECPACLGRWQDHRMIESALQAMPQVEPPAWMVDSVLRGLLRDDSRENPHPIVVEPSPRSGRRGKWIVVSAAACLFAVVGVGLLSQQGSRQLALDPSREHLTEAATVEVATSVVAVINDLRAEYRDLAAETSASARDFAAVLPPGGAAVWNSNERLRRESEQAPAMTNAIDRASSTGAVSSIGRSFGDQIGQAMDFLWAAVPETVPRG